MSLDANQIAREVEFRLTDYGNAERLVARHGQDIRHAIGLGWLVWDGLRWRADTRRELVRMAKSTARAILHDAADCADDAQRKAILGWAAKAESAPHLKAMVDLAASEKPVDVLPAELDADPWLLTVENGVVDLRTGKLAPARRADLATKLAPVHYDLHARSAQWDEFLLTTCGGDRGLVDFLARAVGYTLTGSTCEEVLFFAHGPSATGKSTFFETIKSVLGEHAVTADFETFLRRSGDGGIRNDVARLAGARMVLSLEVDEGKALAEGLIKAITGGDTVSARFLYREAFEFSPHFTLWLAANHRPAVRADDEAMWRRIVQIPFTHVVPPAERDPKLKAALRDDPESRSAILTWAVRGCLDWQRQGLAIPGTVREYTQEYRAENDPLSGWLTDRCQLNDEDWTTTADLRRSYENWCDDNDDDPLDVKPWTVALRAHGLTSHRRKTARGWNGIATMTGDA